jgi:hypothetical protein
MKIPTTEFSKEIHSKAQITRDFLLSQGWTLKEEYPLFETFVHPKNSDLICSIGLYGSFNIVELHWCNKTPEREFSTINHDLTKDDYFKILDLRRIKI